MRPESLPSELIELERRLAHRTADEQAASLRDRVLHAAALELATPRPSIAAELEGWHLAASAAGVLIVMNFSMIWASRSEFSVWSKSNNNQAVSELHAIALMEAGQEGPLK